MGDCHGLDPMLLLLILQWFMISCYICGMLCGYIVIFAGLQMLLSYLLELQMVVIFAGFASVDTLIAGIAIGCLSMVCFVVVHP